MGFFKSFEEIDQTVRDIEKKEYRDFSGNINEENLFLTISAAEVSIFDYIRLDRFVYICYLDYKNIRDNLSSELKTLAYTHNPFESFSEVLRYCVFNWKNKIYIPSEEEEILNFFIDMKTVEDKYYLFELIVLKNLYIILKRINHESLDFIIEAIKLIKNTDKPHNLKFIKNKYNNPYTTDLYKFIITLN